MPTTDANRDDIDGDDTRHDADLTSTADTQARAAPTPRLPDPVPTAVPMPIPAQAKATQHAETRPLAAAGHFGPAPIHRLVATVCAPACALGGDDGQIEPVGVSGLYVGETRALRRAVLAVDGTEVDTLGMQHDGPGVTTFFGTARRLGDPVPDPTVRIDRMRRVRPDGLEETVRIRSTATAPVRTTVTLSLDCDLTPMDVARTGRSRPSVPARLDGTALVWAGDRITVTVEADGARLDADHATISWPIDLHTDDELTLRWSVHVREPSPLLIAPGRPADWSRPEVVATDPRIGRLVGRALDDLESLRLTDPASPDGEFIAAGVPWFLTLFGRDSIWAARMMLPVGTSVAEGTLATLARRQATLEDPESGAAPGKIMHELRRHDSRIGLPGAPAESGTASVYYGTVDATLLWINLLADAWRWGMPDESVVALMPHLRRALAWIDGYADPNRDGFIEYVDLTGRGLANQGWKDSGTSVRFHDGSMATPPIALCEVQAYAHRAATDAAVLLDAFGKATQGTTAGRLDDPDHWRTYAADLSERFRARFWVGGSLGDYPAQGLDGHGHPIDALTSNIGHLLGTGLLSATEEAAVASLIASPELSGGYGLRTMSTLDAAYDPLTYHCGSIWPHDTAITLLGLASMAPNPDARAAAATLVDGLLAAAESFDYRLPELYSGDARDDVAFPLPHPAACRPQAWSAAAAIALLQALLGLSVDVPAAVLSVMPLAAGPMSVRGLRIAGQAVDVDIDSDGRVKFAGAASGVDGYARVYAGGRLPR